MFKTSNFVDRLEHHAANCSTELAVTFLANGEDISQQLSYTELARLAKTLAAAIQARVAVGERALLLYPSGCDFIVALLACWYAGVVPVPGYPPASVHHLQRLNNIIADAQPRLVLFNHTVARKLQRLQFSTQEPMVFLNTDDTLAAGVWQDPKQDPDSLALLQYTSGSCGQPKGVMVTHANIMANQEMIKIAFKHNEQSKAVGWVPHYHDMGLIGDILQPLYLGGQAILMPAAKFIQRPARWLEAIMRFGGTTGGAPNFAYELCAQKITAQEKRQLRLECWQVAYCGAEPVRAATVKNFITSFAECGFNPNSFFPCYGLAEATLFVSGGTAQCLTIDKNLFEQQRISTTVKSKPCEWVSCGKPCGDERIVIVDPHSKRVCSKDEIGEIWVKGSNVALGYWRQELATAQTFAAYLDDSADGPYLRTGDLGFIHEGLLYVSGRLKDLIIIKGLNHYPQDIEHSVENCHPLLHNPGAIVFTVEDEVADKLVVVQEVRQARADELPQVAQTVRETIAHEHGLSVDDIVFVKPHQLPRTTSGKVQRQLCKRWYLEHHLGEIPY